MRKLKLLLAMCALLGGAFSANAQTDVTSDWISNADFSGSYEPYSITSPNTALNSDRNIYLPDGWSIELVNKSANNMSVVKNGDAQQASFFTSTYAPGDGKYMVRFRDKQTTEYIDLYQNVTVPVSGLYTFSADLIRQDGSKITVALYAGTSVSVENSSGGTWQNRSFTTVFAKGDNIKVGVKFRNLNNSSSDGYKAGADNIKVEYVENVNGPLLAALIAQATSINNSKGGLTSAIETAQGVYDGIDNTPDYQDDIDDAITALKEAIDTKLATITFNHLDDVSYLIANSGFEEITAETNDYSTVEGKDYTIDGWILDTTCDSGRGAVLTYGSGFKVNNALIPESDNDGKSGKALGLSVGWEGSHIYRTAPITLPSGDYSLKIYGYNAGTNTPLTSKFGFVPTSGEPTLSTKTSYTKNTWEEDEVTFSLATATEGYFQFGGVAASGSGDNTAKVFFDNITLTYLNPLQNAQSLWQDVHNALAALDATALPDAAEEAITTALTETVPTTSVDDVNNAKAALQALIDSYDAIKAAYDKTLDLITLATAEKTNSTGTKTTIEAAISTATTNIESRTTADALTEDYNTLETARRTYVLSGAEPAEEHPFEFTFKIVNPSFEDDIKSGNYEPNGWTVPNRGAVWGVKPIGSTTNMDGNYKFNNWQTWWMDCNVRQVIEDLPNGRYEVSAVLSGNSGTSIMLMANDSSTSKNMTGENNGIPASVTTDVTDGSLTIKAQGGSKEGSTLLNVDNFTMKYLGNKPVLDDLITSATEITTTEANVGTGVFQIPSSAVETLTSAITTAQGYNDIYGDDLQTAIDNLNDAIDAYQDAELNAPDENKRYWLTIVDNDKDWDGNAITFIAGGRSDQGNYGVKYLTAANANFNQALKFTATTGNKYKVSALNADGTEQYLTTANLGYNAGTDNTNKERIRTTNDVNKALEIEILATTTANQFKLYNTDRGAIIANNNNNDVFTANDANFTITEASQASVNVSIDKNVKYATRIFPFTPTLPSGVKAYSCEASDGDVLTLVEETTLAANTPYILETSVDVNETLEGWGVLASTEAATVGWLTGVYTQTDAPNGSYVLQNNNDKVGFYQVDTNAAQPKVGANRCYLSAAAFAEAREAYFFDEATGVDAIKMLTDGKAAIYNASGTQIPTLQKGMNIIKQGGKTVKVMVK